MGKPTSDELKKMEVRTITSVIIQSLYCFTFLGTEEVPSRSSGVGLFQRKDFITGVYGKG